MNYRGVNEKGPAVADRSGSRDRIPKVNNYTKVMHRISPARAQDASEKPTNGVYDRLYGRSRPAVAARSLSRDPKPVKETGPPRANVPRQFTSQGRLNNAPSTKNTSNNIRLVNKENTVEASSKPTLASREPAKIASRYDAGQTA